MRLKNTDARYGLVAVLFHWIVAVCIIGLLALGLYMAGLPNNPGKLNLYALHKSVGITVLTLAALRLGWKIANIAPRSLPGHKAWEKILAKIAHTLLYVSMFAMPLSGWIMSSAKGYSVSVFHLFTLPDLVKPDKELASLAVLFHQTWAWVLIGTIALHAAGALKHHVIDKDSTLRRMLPGVRLGLVLMLLAVPGARAADDVARWAIEPAQSSLTFEGTQMGAKFTGTFSTFGGEIAFDPARLAESHARIMIASVSATTGSPDRDSYIGQPVWLNAESFPESVFECTTFEKTAEDRYVAHGTLELRGVKLPVELPFTLTMENGPEGNKVAKMTGEAVLKRLDFGIGAGEWADEKAVGNQVTVRVSLIASPAPVAAAAPAP